MATTPVAGGAHSDDAQPHDIHQAAALRYGTALASAGLTGIHSHRASGSTTPESPAPTWGRIANESRQGQRILTGLFFGGPPNPNSLPLYTRHPATPKQLDWTDQSDIRFAAAVRADRPEHAQALLLRHQGETDRFAPAWLFSQRRWPGDGEGTYTEAEQIERARQLFTTAAELTWSAPMVEVGLDFFRFWQDFPFNLDELVRRAGCCAISATNPTTCGSTTARASPAPSCG